MMEVGRVKRDVGSGGEEVGSWEIEFRGWGDKGWDAGMRVRTMNGRVNYVWTMWNEMPENAGAISFSVEAAAFFADLKSPSTVFPMFIASFPGMFLVPHLGQMKADTFSTSA